MFNETPIQRLYADTSTFREFSKRRNVKPNSTLRKLIREEIDAALKRVGRLRRQRRLRVRNEVRCVHHVAR